MQAYRIIVALAAAGVALTPQTPSPRAVPDAGNDVTVGPSPRLRPLPPASKDVATGPAAGSRIPTFRLADQSGRPRDFRSLTGRNGLLLAFVRSADW